MTGGEGEQHMHSIARCLTQPEVIYLSHDVAGVWRSINAGESWEKCLDIGLYINAGQSIAVDPVNPNVVLLEIDNTYNYRSTAAEGLYRSEDGGKTWVRVLATATNYQPSEGRSYREAIAADLDSVQGGIAQVWYAAFPENGVFRSVDGGLSFSQMSSSSLTGHKVVFGVYPVPGESSNLFVATDQGLHLSTEFGANLQPVGDLPAGRVTSVAIDHRDSERVYALVEGLGMYRSLDGGEHFTLLKAFNGYRAFMNPGYPDVIYVVGSQYTIVTHDGGATWIENAVSIGHPETGQIDTGNRMEIDGRISGFAPNPEDPNEAVGFSKASLWKTTDGGRTYIDSSTLFTGFAWSWWNSGAAFDQFDPYRFAFFNNDVGMTITENGGDYFVNRNPEAWYWYQSGLIGWIGTYAGDFQPTPDSSRIVSAVGDYFRTQLMVTSNLGTSWDLLTDYESVNETLDLHIFVAFHPDDPNFVYGGDKTSTDAGLTFEPIDFGVFSSGDPTVLGFCRENADTAYAAYRNGTKILRTDDRGLTWRDYGSLSWSIRPFDSIPTFAADPEDPDIIYTLDSSGDLARFDGTSWESLDVLDMVDGVSAADGYYNYVRRVTVDPRFPEIVYAGMFSSGVDCIWRSTDEGATWENISGTYPRVSSGPLAVSPHTGELFVGTAAGTWIYPPPYETEIKIADKAEPSPAADPVQAYSYEGWCLEHFKLSGYFDPEISGPTADSDDDELSNLIEYAMDRNPNDRDAPGFLSVLTDTNVSEISYTLSFRERTGDSSLDLVLYTSLNLAGWQTIEGSTLTTAKVVETPLSNGLSEFSIELEEAASFTGSRFFKLDASISSSEE
jgi:hypothetical protein